MPAPIVVTIEGQRLEQHDLVVLGRPPCPLMIARFVGVIRDKQGNNIKAVLKTGQDLTIHYRLDQVKP